ncbi:MAG: hypothetical protein C0601_13320 [Candidatus Muiribacterium halophilum]|uniref:Osmotically inducible protein OsmC n=1 Tax=Muiribacterium halophilum TaxID=2053465 RepID=A0A2N5Z9D6_MUIH1|nr:MAG: hypothetical protein C0601_13320 [Candidatus Muirbacterium halophilum]
MRLDFIDNMTFEVTNGPVKFRCDQPKDDGGDGNHPNPSEMFIASISMCAATYAGFFYKREGLSMEGFNIDISYEVLEKPRRYGNVTLKIYSPNVPEKKRKKYEKMVGMCIVGKTVHEAVNLKEEFIYI